MTGLLKKGFLFLLVTVSSYPVFILLLTNPWLQRHALYAHKIHSGFYHDVNDPESFGFATHQIIPFNLSTSDNETLYGWHILPLNVYFAHQFSILSAGRRALLANDPSILQQFALSLFHNDKDARAVVNFHGNAGHVAQGWRTDTYRSLSAQPHTHVFTVDYRGFGKSTGQPTESGIIADGIALAEYVMDFASPERIVVLGQSLGTAVATAVGLHFADPGTGRSRLLPELPSSSSSSSARHAASASVEQKEPKVFAGIILVAPFTSLPSLLLSYRIGGLLPVLAPLRPYPRITALVEGYILDKWHTALRLTEYVKVVGAKAGDDEGARGNVQIVHATNDADISVEQGRLLFQAATGAEEVFNGVGEKIWAQSGSAKVRLQIVEHGGHNRIVTYAPVALAVMRAFDESLRL